ncbi:hypothetical protein GCM10010207_58850 [Streptomyces atratus]|nr:hypothetical protein GCM10010207_58850 [Streptomyces atratus]
MARPYPALRTTASIGTAAVLLAGAALGAAPAATARPAAAAVAASAPGLGFYDIPGSGGITLKGNVFTAAGAQPGERHPLIVLPTSWGLPQVEYLAQAQQLADSGYVVVSYTSRGLWLSGGDIEVAGPPVTDSPW